jgi:hypothetical protein
VSSSNRSEKSPVRTVSACTASYTLLPPPTSARAAALVSARSLSCVMCASSALRQVSLSCSALAASERGGETGEQGGREG